jgi:hypothetical protein
MTGRSEAVAMSNQHRLPDHAVRTGLRALYCIDCTQEMKTAKVEPAEPGRETWIYVCDCGRSERVIFDVDSTWVQAEPSQQRR